MLALRGYSRSCARPAHVLGELRSLTFCRCDYDGIHKQQKHQGYHSKVINQEADRYEGNEEISAIQSSAARNGNSREFRVLKV